MTIPQDRLEDLATRVRAASGPDRAIDMALAQQFIPQREPHRYADEQPFDEPWVAVRAAAYTASIDAALALVERVLPGWQVNVSLFGNVAEASMGGRGVFPYARAPTAPIAILSCALSALIEARNQ